MESIRHVYLARHGQTALNAEGRLRGLADPPLDDLGEHEARRLAEVLAAFAPDRVLSSPLQRARRTAQIIADLAGVPAQPDPRFNDRDYGPQTARIKADVIAQYGSVDNAPGVEPTSAVLARARPGLDEIVDNNDISSIVIVTHDAVIRPLIRALDPDRPEITAPTASWNRLIRLDGTWSVELVDQKP